MNSGAINKKIADLARKYTTLSTEQLDVTHCLDHGDFFFCPDVEWMRGVDKKDAKSLVEVYEQVYNRFAQCLPEGYGELITMLSRLRNQAQKAAWQIDRLYALPQDVKDEGDLKSRLHELRRLTTHVKSLISEYGREVEIRELFPDCLELRYIASSKAYGSLADSESFLKNLRECVIYERAGFYPTLSYAVASLSLGEVQTYLDSALEHQEEEATRLYRNFAWIRAQYNNLQRSLFEFEVYGNVSTINREEATKKTREEARKRGRPREIDREAVQQAIKEILVNERNCWHQSGADKGRPNASVIHKRLVRLHTSLVTKNDGSPVTCRWVRKRLGEIDDDTIEKLRRKNGST